MADGRGPRPEATAGAALRAAARARGPWRRAAIVYALALTTGTHWPQLRLGAEVPATDKTIHLLAFAGLTFVLWHAQWVRRRAILVLLVLAWAGADEAGQAVPGLHRVVSWQDVLANALGVLVVSVWLWALGPVGGAINRMRLDLHRHVFHRLFAHGRTWMVFAGIFLACAAPVAVLRPLLTTTMTARAIIVATCAWLLASGVVLVTRWRAVTIAVIAKRACFACWAPTRGTTFDEKGRGRCAACARPLHRGQWIDPARPAARGRLSTMLVPVLVTTGAIAAMFALLLAFPLLYPKLLAFGPTATAAPRVARIFGTLPPTLHRAIDLSLLLVAFAISVRLHRTMLARVHDRAARCRHCGHDLRATPLVRGIGRCGECGTEFARDGGPEAS